MKRAGPGSWHPPQDRRVRCRPTTTTITITNILMNTVLMIILMNTVITITLTTTTITLTTTIPMGMAIITMGRRGL